MGGLAVDLEGKVALVSGGSSGMGTAICTVLAASGASVVVGGRHAERTAAVVESIRSTGRSAAPAIGDVADSTQAEHLVATALTEFGGLDIVINAAGVIHRADAEGTTDDDARGVAGNEEAKPHRCWTQVEKPFFSQKSENGPHFYSRYVTKGIQYTQGETSGFLYENPLH